MHIQTKFLLLINVIGGILVLGSYAHGIITHTNNASALWGDISQNIQFFYKINILLATLGYFMFTYFFIQIDPEKTIIYNHFNFKVVNILYIAFLVPSIFWMPLTWLFIDKGFTMIWLWYLIRIILLIVGLASLGIVLTLFYIQPKGSKWIHIMAILGSIFLCIQTLILDGFLWPVLFKKVH